MLNDDRRKTFVLRHPSSARREVHRQALHAPRIVRCAADAAAAQTPTSTSHETPLRSRALPRHHHRDFCGRKTRDKTRDKTRSTATAARAGRRGTEGEPALRRERQSAADGGSLPAEKSHNRQAAAGRAVHPRQRMERRQPRRRRNGRRLCGVGKLRRRERGLPSFRRGEMARANPRLQSGDPMDSRTRKGIQSRPGSHRRDGHLRGRTSRVPARAHRKREGSTQAASANSPASARR